jgi:hypothetical protein
MSTIGKSISWQVIGYNKDGTQLRLCSASSRKALMKGWAEDVKRHQAHANTNILPTFVSILVWNVERGWMERLDAENNYKTNS